jgi:hypothetical protein
LLTFAVLTILGAQVTSPGLDAAQVPVSLLRNSQLQFHTPNGSSFGSTKAARLGGQPPRASAQSGIPGIDSIANWTGSFVAPGYDRNGNPRSVWPYAMIGRAPESASMTSITAPIVPIIVDLLLPDGTIAIYQGTPLSLDPTPYIGPLLQSPLFENFNLLGDVTQYTDALYRLEFADRTPGNSWHTNLVPKVKQARHMRVPWGAWIFGIDEAGHLLAGVESSTWFALLFPPDYPFDDSTIIGAAELAGDMTTRDLSIFATYNIALYDGTTGRCCVGGFHEYDFEPGVPENGNLPRLYVMAWASWYDPGFFVLGGTDIMPFSHELAEAFHDPFISNLVPWSLSVDPIFGNRTCTDLMEVGDIVEVLSSNPVFAAQSHGRTYHLQNEATFSWFAGQSPSVARNGAYSFPDESTLIRLSPPNLTVGCTPAP